MPECHSGIRGCTKIIILCSTEVVLTVLAGFYITMPKEILNTRQKAYVFDLKEKADKIEELIRSIKNCDDINEGDRSEETETLVIVADLKIVGICFHNIYIIFIICKLSYRQTF